ncbi:unnamed protein product (macronuclear) [Paramecium tetraurelia]|uniref:Uncharacterized protein n=1 Tax=Paramecium tetraurelia TaxID=5888 RepID=A0EDC1_PARTE|nr:uncharacterized protein GSPATT00004157001 [Paramecium tetraurelia]CAK93288.1 unnamed protein product [Paramecium tetraurelia]|eukprot:XP_001460685.1 hypothetical protein (macronuclear) [Paramecium tetraurelia strain d4-2]
MKQNKQNIHKVIRKRPWTDEEDFRVIELVQEFGPQKWTQIAQQLDGRIGKQCRERWHNHLNPLIKKTPWEEDEEWVLFLYHKALSNKWAEIAKHVQGRTDNSIKNHWNSGMKKRMPEFQMKLSQIKQKFKREGISILNDYDPLQKKALEIILMNKQYKSIISESSENEDVSYPTKQSKKNRVHLELIELQRDQQVKGQNDEMIEQNYISHDEQEQSNR